MCGCSPSSCLVAHFFAFQLPGGKGLLALGVQIVIATLLFALSVWLFPKFLPVTMRSVIFAFQLPGGKGLLTLGVQIVIATLLFALSVWLFPKFLPATMRSVISQSQRISKR